MADSAIGRPHRLGDSWPHEGWAILGRFWPSAHGGHQYVDVWERITELEGGSRKRLVVEVGERDRRG